MGTGVSELAAGICLLNSPELWRNASHASREYYLQNHALDKAIEWFERVFFDVIDNVPSGNTNVVRTF